MSTAVWTLTGGTFTSSPGRNCDGTPICAPEHGLAVSARLVFTARVRVKLGVTLPPSGRGSSHHILMLEFPAQCESMRRPGCSF